MPKSDHIERLERLLKRRESSREHVEYATLRARKGTQREVADALGISRATLINREAGNAPLKKENWIALEALPDSGRERITILPPDEVEEIGALPLRISRKLDEQSH